MPPSSMPARRIAAAAASADAIGPFMSARAAADQSAVLDRALPRSVRPGRRVAGGDDVEVAVPRERGALARADRGHDARPAFVAPDDLGSTRRSPARMSDGDRGGLVLGAAGVLARRGDQRARERAGPRRRRPPPAAASSERASSTMALDGTRHPRAHGAARRAGARPVAVARAAGDRLAAVLAPLVEEPEPSLVFTVRVERPVAPRRRDLVPGRAAGSGRDAQRRRRSASRARRSGWIRGRRACSARCRRSTRP